MQDVVDAHFCEKIRSPERCSLKYIVQ